MKVRELAGAVGANARTFETRSFATEGEALEALPEATVVVTRTAPAATGR